MKENSLKFHLAKVFTALGGLSTLAVSCGKYGVNPDGSVLSDETGSSLISDEMEDGIALLPEELFVPEEVDVQAFEAFLKDILSNPQLQDEFVNNPYEFLARYNLSVYSTDSSWMQMLLAFCDKEITEAILKNDVGSYLSLMEQKGYLQSDFVQLLNERFREGNIQELLKVVETRGAWWKENCMFIMAGVFVGLALIAAVVVATVTLAITVTEVKVHGAASIKDKEVIVDRVDDLLDPNSDWGKVTPPPFDPTPLDPLNPPLPMLQDAGQLLLRSAASNVPVVRFFFERSASLSTISLDENKDIQELREAIQSLPGEIFSDEQKDLAFKLAVGTFKGANQK